MKTIALSLLLSFLSVISFCQNDSMRTSIINIQEKIKILENRTEEIKRDQLNYSIEKNLLKETYSNNYETINFVLTIILGVIGILGYFGIKDINSIKKEYSQELDNLRRVKLDFETQSKAFDIEKAKLDTDLKAIIKQNEEQNNKIKLLEIKEKAKHLINENQITSALEYCAIGLEIAPNDPALLNCKAMANCRLNNLHEALETLQKLTEIEPSDMSYKVNYIECLLFANELKRANQQINSIEQYLNEREDGNLLPYLRLIEKYHSSDEQKFLEYAKSIIDMNDLESAQKRLKHWTFMDSLYFIVRQPETRKQLIFKNTIWYLDGQINGKTLCERLNIQLLEKEKTHLQVAENDITK